MSLLTSVNSGAPGQPYFIKNSGGANVGSPVPIIASSLDPTSPGVVRLTSASGMVLRSDPSGVENRIRGGLLTGSQLYLGSSATYANTIALDDSGVSIVGPTTVAGDINTTGNIVLALGQSLGKSISGYYAAAPTVNVPASNAVVVPNPAGITAGWYAVGMVLPAGGSNVGQRSCSTIAHFNGSLWDAGGVCNGVDVILYLTDDHTSFAIFNNSGVAYPTAQLSFAKLMN